MSRSHRSKRSGDLVSSGRGSGVKGGELLDLEAPKAKSGAG